MNDVLVSYQGGQFGDWLRYLISQHDGFERFRNVKTDRCGGDKPKYPNFTFENMNNISMHRWNTLEEFKSQLIESNLRQVYKPKAGETWSHNIAHNPENYYNDNVNWKYYNIARQTDISIIFVSLDPLSELFEVYLKRQTQYPPDIGKGNILSEEDFRDNCYKSYIHKEHPKHELNHVVKIDQLAEYDEEEYNRLTTFLKVRPLDNWKYYVKQLDIVKEVKDARK